VFPDQYIELEAHDRTIIDLPPIQHQLAAKILALNIPTVLVLFNGGAVAIDAEASAHICDYIACRRQAVALTSVTPTTVTCSGVCPY
jgi:hypothetical protein